MLAVTITNNKNTIQKPFTFKLDLPASVYDRSTEVIDRVREALQKFAEPTYLT
jgi:hypothetical protein